MENLKMPVAICTTLKTELVVCLRNANHAVKNTIRSLGRVEMVCSQMSPFRIMIWVEQILSIV